MLGLLKKVPPSINLVIVLVILIPIHKVNMNISQTTLPNQLNKPGDITENMDKNNPDQVEVSGIQTKENQENRENLSEDVKEIKECIRKLKQNDEDNTEYIRKLKQKDDRKESRWVRGVVWSAYILITLAALFWASQVFNTFTSEPLMSTTSIVRNKTLTWPTITLEPDPRCYNQTALKELRKAHNITLLKSHWDHIFPFKITEKNFNWSGTNVSKIYLQTKYRPTVVSFTWYCLYGSRLRRGGEDCYNEKMGEKKTYDTQYNAKESFTLVAASSNMNFIRIGINRSLCNTFLSIHPPTDQYYDPHPYAKTFFYNKEFGQGVTVTIKSIEELHRINTISSPCVEDKSYNQPRCYEEKITEYKIKRAGCHFPGITGYRKKFVEKYPECNNNSSFHRFMYWHQELYSNRNDQFKYIDLEKMKNECGEPCDTRKYITTTTNNREEGRTLSNFRIEMDPNAMSYQSINEQKAMPLDILVANVGGILGLFLGISCLTAVNAVQFIIRIIMERYLAFQQT